MKTRTATGGNQRKIAVAILLVVIIGVITAVVRNWPFTQAALERTLSDELSASVRIGAFHSRWFPRPGFDATGVQISTSQGPISIDHVTVESSYGAFLHHSHDLALVHLDGASAHLSRGPFNWSADDLAVDDLLFDRSSLEIAPANPGGTPFQLGIPHADLHDVARAHPVRFHAQLDWPRPRGRLDIQGQYGPRSATQEDTPASGRFRLEHADLAAFQNLLGSLTAQGNFSGPFGAIKVDGEAQVADLKVGDRAHHRVDIAARFTATVNGSNADTRLDSVESSFLGSAIHWTGDVADREVTNPSAGKEARLHMTSEKARVQDLLYVVTQAPRPALNGPISVRAEITLPPGHRPFLEKLRADGDFGIGGARFGKPNTQSNVATLSERARGQKKPEENPESIISDIQGHVSLRNGVAVLSNITFHVPGASAALHGTFNIINYAVDLRGKLALEKELSDTTTGFKSFLLKALDPFFKRKNAGAVLPVSITGTYQKPVFSALGMHPMRASSSK